MNKARPGAQTLNDLVDIQRYFDKNFPLLGEARWDPRLSKSECVPMRVASWFVVISESSPMMPANEQKQGRFVWFERWCVNLLMAIHKLRKAAICRESGLPGFSPVLSAEQYRDEAAGSYSTIAQSVTGLVQDMRKAGASSIKLPLHGLQGCEVCEGWGAEMIVEALVQQGLSAGGKAVQLRTDKHVANPAHPAYKATLENFADMLVVAGLVLDEEEVYSEQAAQFRAMAASLENGSLIQISAALGHTADRTDRSSPLKCANCLEKVPSIMADECRHVYLCADCFEVQKSYHDGSTSFPCFMCRTVSSHGVVVHSSMDSNSTMA